MTTRGAARPDPFAALLPATVAGMPVAWNHLRVPGPPPAFALTAAERDGATALARFRRRLIAELPIAGAPGVPDQDHLALIDKAIPHARLDLMLTEVSAGDKPTPVAVAPATGAALWRCGLDFVRFVSDPAVQRAFGLAGGRAHLALNCDPHTRDRESVQAAKQFHLHLIYWRADELAPLARPDRLDRITDPRLRRQCLDPLAFLGARLVTEALAGLDLGLGLGPDLGFDRGPAVGWVPPDDAAIGTGTRPLGALLRLPGWGVLGTPGFEALIRRLHLALADLAARVQAACTGEPDPPTPWRRHRLLPATAVASNIDAVGDAGGWSPALRAGLRALAAGLHDLAPTSWSRLRRMGPAARMHTLTLIPPCYSLTLHAAGANRPDAPLADAPEVLLAIAPRLFSGIGGAGLLSLGRSDHAAGATVGPGSTAAWLPSARVLRGQGAFSADDWLGRARFQHAFALRAAGGDVRRLRDFSKGWA